MSSVLVACLYVLLSLVACLYVLCYLIENSYVYTGNLTHDMLIGLLVILQRVQYKHLKKTTHLVTTVVTQ